MLVWAQEGSGVPQVTAQSTELPYHTISCHVSLHPDAGCRHNAVRALQHLLRLVHGTSVLLQKVTHGVDIGTPDRVLVTLQFPLHLRICQRSQEPWMSMFSDALMQDMPMEELPPELLEFASGFTPGQSELSLGSFPVGQPSPRACLLRKTGKPSPGPFGP